MTKPNWDAWTEDVNDNPPPETPPVTPPTPPAPPATPPATPPPVTPPEPPATPPATPPVTPPETPEEPKGLFDDTFSNDNPIIPPTAKTIGDVAKALNIELKNPEDVTEFVTGINSVIEKSKREFKLDDAPAEARDIINHFLHNNGSVLDFYNNPQLRDNDEFLSLKPEGKVYSVQLAKVVAEAKAKNQEITEEEANNRVKDIMAAMSSDEINTLGNELNTHALNLKKQIINNILTKGNEQAELRKQNDLKQKQAYTTALTELVNKTEDYFGIKMPEATRKKIAEEVVSGDFQKTIDENRKEIEFYGYLHKKYGSYILNKINFIQELDKKVKLSSINEELITKLTGQSSASGAGSRSSGSKEGFDKWTDI